MKRIVLAAAIVAGVVLGGGAAPLHRGLPRPLPSHPGNIFLAGEPVLMAEPSAQTGAWRVVDYDGKIVATGRFENGRADIGPLPVGWYELASKTGQGSNLVTFGVLEPLRAATPATSPIGIDVALAWCCPPDRWADMISLCQLAGMNRVRDRCLWPEIEPQRGQFAAHTRYDDSVRAQTAAGLQVLDVNHVSAPWANTNHTHFPPDLRDVYDFYRVLARRWRGQVEALEPWNEADIKEFGGHTGSEMATFQKAAWLGLKAGNPDLTVCQNVFAIHRSSTLHDFQDNDAWPYFDTFNLHHYDPFEKYPWLFRKMRAVSAGKPMWVSECNVVVQWADEKTKEPSPADLRIQSERVPMIYSMDIYEGARAVFYFMLPDYVEYRRQYGILHSDLTPRPAFLAAAAAGRLLAAAKPLGRLQSTNQDLQGYLFNARPDGVKTQVFVIWAAHDTTFDLPKPPMACFDHLGRLFANPEDSLKVSQAPIYVELARGTRLPLLPPPKPAKLLTGRPGPVVLQALLPEQDIVLNESAYKMPEGGQMTVPVFLYNFGAKAVRGTLNVTAPLRWTAELPREVEIDPGAREELKLHLTHPEIAGMTNFTVRMDGRFDHGGGNPVLSFRLTSSK